LVLTRIMKMAAAMPIQQSQRTQLEQQAIELLVRVHLFGLRRHDQDPSHAGDQADEEKRLGGDFVIQQNRAQRRGDLRNDQNHQNPIEDKHTALQRVDLVLRGLYDRFCTADDHQDRGRHQEQEGDRINHRLEAVDQAADSVTEPGAAVRAFRIHRSGILFSRCPTPWLRTV